MNDENHSLRYILLSTFSFILVILIIFLFPKGTRILDIDDKFIVGLAFAAGCGIGISLGVRPGWLNKMAEKKNQKAAPNKKNQGKLPTVGHHPGCEQFDEHRINLGRIILCAGCLGLIIGFVFALIMTFFYMNTELFLAIDLIYLLVIAGLIFISVNYGESLRTKRSKAVHIMMNILLPTAFMVIVIGIFEITASLYFGLFGVLLSILWMDTRIQLSLTHHQRICGSCNMQC